MKDWHLLNKTKNSTPSLLKTFTIAFLKHVKMRKNYKNVPLIVHLLQKYHKLYSYFHVLLFSLCVCVAGSCFL